MYSCGKAGHDVPMRGCPGCGANVNAAKNRAFKSLEGSVKKMADLDRLGIGRQRNAVVLYWDTSATGFIYFFQFKYPVVFEMLTRMVNLFSRLFMQIFASCGQQPFGTRGAKF